MLCKGVNALNKKLKYGSVILLITVIVISTYAINSGYKLYFPQEATGVEPSIVQVEAYLDGVLWLNGTKVQWGNITVGDSYVKNLTVVNTGNVVVNVSLLINGLPSGWTESWVANNSLIDIGASVSGDLVLIVGSEGTYSWDSWIKAEATDFL